jgi:hypothetical protein
VDNNWTPDVVERQIPLTEGRRPLSLLTDDTEMARWGNEGLPSDSLSVENGAIMCNCARWPLMIDPQLQGIQWVKNRELPHGLKIIQLSQVRASTQRLVTTILFICRIQVLLSYVFMSFSSYHHSMLERVLYHSITHCEASPHSSFSRFRSEAGT